VGFRKNVVGWVLALIELIAAPKLRTQNYRGLLLSGLLPPDVLTFRQLVVPLQVATAVR
jgi:hypothetical protein